ncbi:MAG: site-specific integrase [Selenomonadaceae bacterium]|nr:site-specific integrase [Selenomonadaceae bacterium]
MAVYYDADHKTYYCKFNYTDWTGKKRYTTKRGFSGKRAAEKFEREFKAAALESTDITVSTLIEKYLDDERQHIRKSTFLNKSGALNKYVATYLGNKSITSLTPATVRHWQNQILSCTKKDGTPLARSYAAYINIQFSSMLNFAVRYYGLKKNPFQSTGAIKKRTAEMSIWEESQFLSALQHVSSPFYRLEFLILFYSGMRIGEFKALEISDFDFAHDTISISKSYSSISRTITPPKTDSSVRIISMPHLIMDRLQQYLAKLSYEPSPLFPQDGRTIAYQLKKMAKAAHLPPIRVHDLRHSHASYLIHKHIPITSIAKRLGHKNPSITLSVYSHIYKDSDSQIADMMDESLKKLVNG